MTSAFFLSAFGDEISTDLTEQLGVLTSLNIHGLDLRAALGKNVALLEGDDLLLVKNLCAQFGVQVACLGSPVGKSPLEEPIAFEQQRLEHMIGVGNALGTRRVRIFSFYPPDTSTNQHYDQYVEEVTARLGHLARLAEKEGFILLLENEKGIVTDTPERCQAVLQAVNSPALRFAWDSANFIQVGVAQPVERGWAGLEAYIGYVHIKDALLADGRVTPAGEGDGQLAELLTLLRQSGYQGTLSLEPHLKIAGHSAGFSGTEGMRIAAKALRKLMEQTGCQEVSYQEAYGSSR
jgi:sugar phosphate isomerase/epimerase